MGSFKVICIISLELDVIIVILIFIFRIIGDTEHYHIPVDSQNVFFVEASIQVFCFIFMRFLAAEFCFLYLGY